MPSSTLFGFSIEETDGKLVVVLNGALATAVAQRLREQIDSGQGAALLRYFTPLRGLTPLFLGSPPVRITSNVARSTGTAEMVAPMPIDEVFNQGYEGGLSDFENQMKDFEASLRHLETQVEVTPNASPNKASPNKASPNKASPNKASPNKKAKKKS